MLSPAALSLSRIFAFIASCVAAIDDSQHPVVHTVEPVNLGLQCNTGNHSNNGLLYPSEALVIRCCLFPSNETKNFGPTEGIKGKLTIAISNSSFQKALEWDASSNPMNCWHLDIDRKELFEEYSDLKLPKAYSDSILKWSFLTEFKSQSLPGALYHRMTVSYAVTDVIYRFSWGESITKVDARDSDQRRIYAHLSCQPGSGLLILSSFSRTVVAATWDSFKSEDVIRWYDLTGALREVASFSESTLVYQAMFSSDRLFLITSIGVLKSLRFSGMCWESNSANCTKMKFSKMHLPVDANSSNWSSASLVHSPACSGMDAVLRNGEEMFLRILSSEGAVRVIDLMPSSNDGPLVHSSHTSPSNDVHSDTPHVPSHGTKEPRFKVYTSSFLDGNPSTWHSNVAFPDFTPLQSLILSSSFIFLIGDKAILYSNDAGVSYRRLYEMAIDEEVLNVISHDKGKVAAFLLNSGKILVSRVGVAGPLLRRSNLVSPSIITFDNHGDLYVSSIAWNSTGSSHIVTRLVDMKTNETCNLSLIPHQPNMVDSLVYLDVGDGLVLKATAFANTSDNRDKFPLLTAWVSNAKLLQSRVELSNVTPFSQEIHVTVENSGHSQGSGAVTIMLRNAEPSCVFTSYTVNIMFSCPPSKRLVFDYSSFVERNNLLSIKEFINISSDALGVRLLEKNYRPPSALGISIALSKNIYNFDSEASQNSRLLDYGFIEKYSVTEHCQVNMSSECHCSSAMKFSSSEKFSYCRQRVYEVKYDNDYHINVSVVDEREVSSQNYHAKEYLLFLEEINGRGEEIYSVSDGDNRLCTDSHSHDICGEYSSGEGIEHYQKTIGYMSYGTGKTMYNSTTLTIRFSGTGLFHMRIVLAQGFSHCMLQDEFQVYVTNPPLPFPVGTIVRLSISVAMGGALVIIYMNAVTTKIPDIHAVEEEANPQKSQPHRRINASHVNEDDFTNLRNKFRASFQTTHR